MFTQSLRTGLLASAVIVSSCGGALSEQLAAGGDSFAASSAGLTVLPVKMAGACPRSLLLKVDLGAVAPGDLSYRIETVDGRVSQVFRAPARILGDGDFGAVVEHEIVLLADAEEPETVRHLVFSEPDYPEEAEAQPDFFERLFGTAHRDPTQGLALQSFRVRVTAPNEIVSPFQHSGVTCDYGDLVRKVEEEQRDGGQGGSGGGRGSGGGGGGGNRGGGPVGADGNPI